MKITKRAAAALAASVLALPASACGSGPAGGGSSAACPGGRVRFGIEPYEDPARLKPAYQVMATALQARLGCPVELQVVEDYSAEVLAMRNGRLEIAQFGPLGFVFASRKAGAVPLASFADGGGRLTTYTAGIWVPAGSPVRTVADLRGRSLALGSTGSTSGDALPRYALRQAGVPDRDVRIQYAGGHPEALLALTKGKVDAAEINSQQLAAAEAAGQFDPARHRRIWASAPIPNDPITVSDKLDPAFRDRVARALLGLGAADVARVGAFLDVDPPGPMVAVTRDTYKPLFDLASTMGLTEKDV
ncbi:phosphate/phosphite/phosphonate ABC transporter substrate-binding protein [Actinomadura kijaniata]|uniref:phosphate/phosphite/phosphonate ABC transporter substrate-binding protein n=1 Tax=Actinomadura kijaniata TaxID=46161 RepID=UPI003F198E54